MAGGQTKPTLSDIASRSMDGIISSQGIGDIYRIYYTAKRDGVDFNLAYIPPTFVEESTELFDPLYMSKLYQVGYTLAQGTHPWHKSPEGYRASATH